MSESSSPIAGKVQTCRQPQAASLAFTLEILQLLTPAPDKAVAHRPSVSARAEQVNATLFVGSGSDMADLDATVLTKADRGDKSHGQYRVMMVPGYRYPGRKSEVLPVTW